MLILNKSCRKHRYGEQMFYACETFISITCPSLQTHATMEVLFLAAAMHPDKQKAAQEELDAVVGHGRLPDFSDYDHLPYVQAFVKELMRWHVVAPLGLPHATMEDDEYNGFFIPARTIVNANIWYVRLLRAYSPVIGGSWRAQGSVQGS